jgi:hypothetical protein
MQTQFIDNSHWEWDLTEDVSMGRRYGHQKYIQNNDVYPMIQMDNTVINIITVISIISSIIESLR